MRRRHIRAIAGACLAAVALGACGDNGQAAADVETTEPTVSQAESPAPTPPPEPVTEPSEPLEIPEPDLTIESEADVEKVVREILAFRDWLYAHPSESRRMEAIYWSDCPCAQVLRERLTALVADGVVIEATASNEVASVEVRDQRGDGYTIEVVYRQAPARVVDIDGEVLDEQGGYADPVHEGWVLATDGAGRYRLLGVSPL